jgi:hypothetical protein
MMCSSPVGGNEPLTPDQLFVQAVARFDHALAVATAARAAAAALNPPKTTLMASADSIRNFALVGKARAHLNLNEGQSALLAAQQVAPNFEFRAYYSTNSQREHNLFWSRAVASISGSLANTPFFAMVGDPRIPRVASGPRANAPLSPPSFSSWSNTVAGAEFVQGGYIRIASSLEAQYIIAEVQGPVATTLDFVNRRRAVGVQGPVIYSGAALMADLRDQRRRDFYLDNHRLGDLRRYKRYLRIDEFPKGPYPGSSTGETYNVNADCWPTPQAETSGVK